jgi:thiamine-monophosphate kinase
MKNFEEKNLKTTSISEYGEFGLIEHLTKNLKTQHKETLVGVGDDSAVIESEKNYRLISTDMLVEGVHFDLAYTPLKHLGYKSIAVNISDICAMNGVAKQVTIALAVSNRFSVEALEELYEGINLACDKYNIDVIGGDTTSSTSGLTLSVSIFGEVDKKQITYRSGAKKTT